MMGWLAIIGIPPLSGFFTKEPIIVAAFARPGWTGWLYGLAGADRRGPDRLLHDPAVHPHLPRPEAVDHRQGGSVDQHPHESPPVMTIPLILLAIGSICRRLPDGDPGRAVAGAASSARRAGEHPKMAAPHHHGAQPGADGRSVPAWRTRSSARAPRWSRSPPGRWSRPPATTSTPTPSTRPVFEKPGNWLTRALVFLDNKGVDGLVNGLAALVGGGSGRLRRLQTGFVRSYALSMLIGGGAGGRRLPRGAARV